MTKLNEKGTKSDINFIKRSDVQKALFHERQPKMCEREHSRTEIKFGSGRT